MRNAILWNLAFLLLAGCVLTLAMGCNSRNQSSETAEGFASALKVDLVSYLKQAKNSPDRAANSAEVGLETLEGAEARSTGQYDAVIDQLTAGFQELQQLAEESNEEAIKAKVDELLALANELPGEAGGEE